MKRKNLSIVRDQRQPEDSPERFARLTQHLRVNGKPLESALFKLAAEREAAQ